MGHPIELHGQPMYGGRGIWKNVAVADRLKLFDDALATLATHQCVVMHSSIDKTRLGYEAIAKAGNDPHFLAFQYLVEKAEMWLAHQTDPMKVRCLIIADETPEHDAYCIKMIHEMQHGRRGIVPGATLEHIVDTAHFVRSQDSRGVQLADLVAYTLNRHARGGSNAASVKAMTDIHRTRIAPICSTWRETWPAKRRWPARCGPPLFWTGASEIQSDYWPASIMPRCRIFFTLRGVDEAHF